MIEATYVDHMGSDLSVVNAARVSFGKKSELECIDMVKGVYVMAHKDTKLIQYLAKNKHLSPFGHCFASFHIKAPIFVARQLVKHKFLRWNEISRRYVDSDPEFYYVDKWRGRSEDKKQGSSGTVDVKGLTNLGSANWASVNTYHSLLQLGVCPEQARMVLPQNTLTEWYWSGSLDAFSDMCLLRCASDTQAETQEVANQISHKMHELFPVSWMALAKGRQ
ncbi:FAD-dependent thymidylate synthase [bacterium]|nr:FAD-dependent thymidylate synthase [bacterium]